MICKRCGEDKPSFGYKYCQECAEIVRKERQHEWNLRHKIGKKQHPCAICGALIDTKRRYCPACSAERYRTYQREYKRRIRAKK